MDEKRNEGEGLLPPTRNIFFIVDFLKQASIKSLKVGKHILAQNRVFPELKVVFQTLQSEAFESCLPSRRNKFKVGGMYLQHASLYS